MTKKQIAFIIKAATPYISAGAGVVATWLIVHVHLLSLFHTGKDQTAAAITNLVVWGLTTGITWITAHTKLIPDIERWAEIVEPALKPVFSELIATPAMTPHVSLNVHSPGTVNVSTGPDTSGPKMDAPITDDDGYTKAKD